MVGIVCKNGSNSWTVNVLLLYIVILEFELKVCSSVTSWFFDLKSTVVVKLQKKCHCLNTCGPACVCVWSICVLSDVFAYVLCLFSFVPCVLSSSLLFCVSLLSISCSPSLISCFLSVFKITFCLFLSILFSLDTLFFHSY